MSASANFRIALTGHTNSTASDECPAVPVKSFRTVMSRPPSSASSGMRSRIDFIWLDLRAGFYISPRDVRRRLESVLESLCPLFLNLSYRKLHLCHLWLLAAGFRSFLVASLIVEVMRRRRAHFR